MTTVAQRLKNLKRTGACTRCGVARFRCDGKPDPAPVCGRCAALEIMRDATWAIPRDSHQTGIWLAAVEYVQANDDRQLLNDLACDAARLADLKRRLGVKKLARNV